MDYFDQKAFDETCVATNELKFVPRLNGDRWVRILQQKWLDLNVELEPGTFEWRDVPFDENGE